MKLLSKKYIFILAVGTLLLCGCKKDEVPCYEKGADGVYFLNDKQTGNLSKTLNFAALADMPEEATVDINLRLLGNIVNDDIKNVVIKTKAVDDYPEAAATIPEIAFEAGESEKTVQITMHKPQEMNKMYAVTLYIDKATDSNIGVGIDDMSEFTMYVEFSLSKPRQWDWGANQYFGDWSVDKHIYLVKLSGNPDFVQTYDYAGLHMNAVTSLRETIKNTPDQVPDFDFPFVDYNVSYKPYRGAPAYWNANVSKYLGNYDSYMFGAIASALSATVKTENSIFGVDENGLIDLNKRAVAKMMQVFDDLFYRGYTGSSYLYNFYVPMLRGIDYQVSQPACWSDAGCGALLGQYYGEYSDAKYKFMIDTWLAHCEAEGRQFVLVHMFPVYNEYDKDSGKMMSMWDYSIDGEDAIKECYQVFKKEYDKNPSAYSFTFPSL